MNIADGPRDRNFHCPSIIGSASAILSGTTISGRARRHSSELPIECAQCNTITSDQNLSRFTDAVQAAALLSALAHPRRFQIVTLLMEAELEVSAIAKWTGLSQSAASQHLRKLREVKAVKTRRVVQQILYFLGSAGAEVIITSIEQLPSTRIKNAQCGKAA